MSFRVTCRRNDKTVCFTVLGKVNNHMDSLAKYIKAKSDNREGVVIDIRGVTRRPEPDKLFIHILRYPSTCARKLAVVDLEENRAFSSLFEHLARTRGYEVCCFADIETAGNWLSNDHTPSNISPRRADNLGRILAVFRSRWNLTRWPQAITSR